MKQRIITAIIALLVFVPFILYGELPFTLFVYLMATIGLIELIKMREMSNFLIPSLLAIVFLWIMLWDFDTYSIPAIGLEKSEVMMLFVMLLLTYTVFAKNTFNFEDAGFMFLSAVYIGIGFYYLIVTRDAGLNYIFYALLVIWATDTGAYFFGRAFGKKKLWPKISPNKTIEGAVGGILLACLVGIVFQLVDPFPHTMFYMIVITILVSIFGQIGDLVESAFKRHFGVKDSGKLLPGHGGILDRLDSLLFILPLLHIMYFVS
ncbi:phosphatidate cytidylyltransferase [Lentibacillus sp. Marseille-P4043]|uniref:phosphatidate cytidylyltransferase n=1 Tax=Lentibacillus sp. Marseille-P4043 TaxID=2040293 RepID=UPI000D0BE5FB|nr:phosphatidate cytidylyltransferase [Lentibacillus sp. Marseille-P4043]